MPTSSSHEHCKKPDGTTCNKCTRRHHRYLTKAHQRLNPEKTLKMHQLQMQTKKPVIIIFKEKGAFSQFALSKW